MVQCLSDMGQNTSFPKGRRRSLRSLSNRSISKNSFLSHTFTVNNIEDKVEQLNINIASEEELMTLVGVNREIARNIVEHRKAIGRFRKVEDLALVKGIGADKLQNLRSEICVSSRKNQSCVSSRAQSYDSLRSTDSRLTLKSNKLINVNKASVFELQSVIGITQEIAAAIVLYRNKKGNFRQIEDMKKVKNVDWVLLNNISRYLTAENTDSEISEPDEPRPSILTNGYATPIYNGRSNGIISKLPLTNNLTHSSANDIFELLSTYSPRPIIEKFLFSRNGEPAVRIACWNLHEFSFEKANNLGVKEVICRTILENGWSIVAIQDISNVTTLQVICEELNKPRLQRVKEWKGKNHNWNFCMLNVHNSKLGFIYDCDGAVYTDLISLNEGPNKAKNECEILIAAFQIGLLNLHLVNLMLSKNANISILNEVIKELGSEDDLLIMVLIDFSDLDEFLPVDGFESTFCSSTNTCFVPSSAHTKNHHITNILCNRKMQHQLTGINGIIRQGITHLAIPNGWSWGGPASPFCPVWVELFVNECLGTAL